MIFASGWERCLKFWKVCIWLMNSPPGADFVDDVDCQMFVVYENAFASLQDHLHKFVFHNELCIVPSNTIFQHTDTIDHIGTCQCGQDSGQSCFMGSLGINAFAVALTACDPAGNFVELSQFGDKGTDQGQFRGNRRKKRWF